MIRSGAVWPGLAAVLAVVVLVAWAAAVHYHSTPLPGSQPLKQPANAQVKAPVATTSTLPTIQAYLAFADQTRQRLNNSAPGSAKTSRLPVMSTAHTYTAEGMRRLADALTDVPGLSAEKAASTLRNNADAIEKNPASLQHADLVHAAFVRAASAIGTKDRSAGDRLQQLASGIDVDRPLLDQRDAVQRFFVAAGDSIRALTGGGLPHDHMTT